MVGIAEFNIQLYTSKIKFVYSLKAILFWIAFFVCGKFTIPTKGLKIPTKHAKIPTTPFKIPTTNTKIPTKQSRSLLTLINSLYKKIYLTQKEGIPTS